MTQERASRIIAETVKSFKQLRQEKGLSHETLAKKAGVTRPAISHIESGKRNPSLMVALRLAHALETDLSEILRKIEEAASK